MKTPEDIDALLKNLLKDDKSWRSKFPNIEDEDIEFLEKVLASIQDGSRVLVAALHPDSSDRDRFQYMLLNMGRIGALEMLSQVMQRLCQIEIEERS